MKTQSSASVLAIVDQDEYDSDTAIFHNFYNNTVCMNSLSSGGMYASIEVISFFLSPEMVGFVSRFKLTGLFFEELLFFLFSDEHHIFAGSDCRPVKLIMTKLETYCACHLT